ncbi:SGNH/GDSL hydrolase family protein [Parapedobacter deserti]|uniref:SGNH/GDSL hydrolase family protein n=1 Tax=Parapedobacter deserti TaxID=1912957 RepID=A0ABV7JLK3_9SPHI
MVSTFALVLSLIYPSKAQKLFKDGDKVCFLGNSITKHGGFHHYLALFYATRYPNQKIEIINSGIGGDKTEHVLARMHDDALIHQPNWVVLKLGMNDVAKLMYTDSAYARPTIDKERKEMMETYKQNYEKIVHNLLSSKAKLILQTPTIYDETVYLPHLKGVIGRNVGLKEAGKYVKDLAKQYNLPVVDYWQVMMDVTKRMQKIKPTASLVVGDRTHPTPQGHFVMAYQFLKTTKADPHVFSIKVKANRKRMRIVRSNAKIFDSFGNDNGVSFNVLEKSLPFPMPKGVSEVLDFVPFEKELNQELLMVKGLTKGIYTLKIDGISIANYTAAELATGVNIASIATTPQQQQAQKVLKLFEEYWELEAVIRYVRSTEINRLKPLGIESLQEVSSYIAKAKASEKDTTKKSYKELLDLQDNYVPAKMDWSKTLARMEKLHHLIYQANEPIPHRFEIVKKELAQE